MDRENWRAVPGYEGLYEVSDLGRVRSLGKFALFGRCSLRFYPQRVMSPARHYKGHLYVHLRRDGAPQVKGYVHRLVAMAFVPNPDGKPYVNHLSGCKTDNAASNLEWATEGENTRHYYAGVAAMEERNDNF